MFRAVRAREEGLSGPDGLFSRMSGIVKLLEQEGMLGIMSSSSFVVQMGRQA